MTAWLPDHLSVSAVSRYLVCPLQFRQRYVDGLVTPTSPPALFGQAFHAALAAEHAGEDSERALISHWNDAQAALGDHPLLPGKAHALALLDAYQAGGYGGKSGVPERHFLLPFPSPKIPVPLTGYIDLVVPERRRFREFKTTATTTWTDAKIALEAQLHVYGWAYQRLFNHRVDCAEYVIFSTVTPYFRVVEAQPSPQGLRAFVQAAELVWRGIVNERYTGCGTCAVCAPPSDQPRPGPSFDWDEEEPCRCTDTDRGTDTLGCPRHDDADAQP